jgi:hypothetical protein
MISEAEYQAAIESKKSAQATIDTYFREKDTAFEDRMKHNPVFQEDELLYAASARCACGHGLAYPKGCGGFHYWDCSAVLKGVQDPAAKHTERLPFAFYSIKAEGQPSAYGHTTRPQTETP